MGFRVMMVLLLLCSHVCFCAGAGLAFGWSAGVGVKGVLWEMMRGFESSVDKPERPQFDDFDIVRGWEVRPVRGAVGTAFIQKNLHDFFVGSLFLRVQTHISELKWRYDGMSVYRVFEQGARVTPRMRDRTLWGKVGEDYSIKPLRVWDLIAGIHASVGPLTFNIGAGARWLYLEAVMRVRQEDVARAFNAIAALDMRKTMSMTAKGSHFFAVFECVLGWRLPFPLPLLLQLSGAFMVPRTLRYDVDQKPSLVNFYDRRDAAACTTQFGVVRLGGGEVGMALTVSL